MKFNIEVFRFNSSISYNEYYQSLEIDINDELMLSDLMISIQNSIDNFYYDKNDFGFRINDIVIFDNVKLLNIQNHFGNDLIITPISIKYSYNDLLINKNAIFDKYKPILDKLYFLSENSKKEFNKYILINLVSGIDFDDYIGDGYCLFIQWMMMHYLDNVDELLESIAGVNGVFNSIKTKYMIYPYSNIIDNGILELQNMILQSHVKYKTTEKIIKHSESTLSSKKLKKLGLFNG